MVQGIERRLYPRAYFTISDDVFAVFELPGPDKMSLSTNVLSLSEGGISFIGQKETLQELQLEEELFLSRVFEPENLQFLHQIPMAVRHIIDDIEMEHVICGCQFLSMTELQRVKLKAFIEDWLRKTSH